MEINKYTIFLEVAKRESLSKAAKALGYTQSGISHTLKRMEEEMDLSLFHRDRNGAFLTTAGKEIFPIISQIVQGQENLEQTILSLHDLHEGTLNIGTYSSISREWLPHIIQGFKQEYPNIKIHFKEGGSDDILSWVTDHDVDFGLLSTHKLDHIEWIPLKEDSLMAVLPSNYNIRSKKAFPLKEFNDQVFIISTPGTDIDIHHTLETYDIHPDIQYSANDDYTIISMVACNLGISILPKLVLNHYKAPVQTLPLDPPATRQLGIALPSTASASPAAIKFIEYIQNFLEHDH